MKNPIYHNFCLRNPKFSTYDIVARGSFFTATVEFSLFITYRRLVSSSRPAPARGFRVFWQN